MKQTYRCGWCLEIFHREPRTLAEIEELQKTLLITGPAVTIEPIICDGCYKAVVESAISRHGELPVGVSNSGPPNLLLKMMG